MLCYAMQRYFNQLHALNNDLRNRLYGAEWEIDALLSGNLGLSPAAQTNLGSAQRSLRKRPRRGKDAFLDLIDFIADAIEKIQNDLRESARLKMLYSQMRQDVRNARARRNRIEDNIEALAKNRKKLGCIGICADQGQ